MRKDIEYLIQYLNSEEEKRRAGKECDRYILRKLDRTLQMVNQNLTYRTGIFHNFLEYSRNQQAYIAYLITKQQGEEL
jgi:hypothetical protein